MTRKESQPDCPAMAIIRDLANSCGRSRYSLSREAGIDLATMTRFADGWGMNPNNLSKIAAVLGYELTIRPASIAAERVLREYEQKKGAAT